MRLKNYKKLLFLILYFSAFNGIGQKSLKVIYKIESNFDIRQMNHAEAQSMAKMAAEIMNDFEFELLIKNDQSIFRKTKQLVVGDTNPLLYELAAGFCSGNQQWYTKNDDNEKLILLVGSSPSTTLTLDEQTKWEITSEEKNIGKFKVIKATTNRKLGSYNEQIEVWFAPELPFSFGPLGFNGLPGLILEFHRDNVIYKLKEIKEEEVSISPPKSSKKIAFEKYYEMLDSEMAEIKKRG